MNMNETEMIYMITEASVNDTNDFLRNSWVELILDAYEYEIEQQLLEYYEP